MNVGNTVDPYNLITNNSQLSFHRFAQSYISVEDHHSSMEHVRCRINLDFKSYQLKHDYLKQSCRFNPIQCVFRRMADLFDTSVNSQPIFRFVKAFIVK